MIRSQAWADRQAAHSAWFDVGAVGLSMVPLARIVLVNDSRTLAYCALGTLVALLVVAVHCYRGAEWARIAGGLASVAIGAALIANADSVGYPGQRVRWSTFVGFGVPIVAGLHLLLPASRDRFRAVREARDRIRERAPSTNPSALDES